MDGITEQDRPALDAGWYVQLSGKAADLELWARRLKPPFDPHVINDGDEFLLCAGDLERAATQTEARMLALAQIEHLNGAIRVVRSIGRVAFSGLYRVDTQGRRHIYVFVEGASIAVSGGEAEVRVTRRDAEGNLLPPPPPGPSDPQRWLEIGRQDARATDLLDHYGRADNWYDIYKTLEVAAKILGSAPKLRKFLGTDREDYERLRRTANFYRHAYEKLPSQPVEELEAQKILRPIVQQVLAEMARRQKVANVPNA